MSNQQVENKELLKKLESETKKVEGISGSTSGSLSDFMTDLIPFLEKHGKTVSVATILEYFQNEKGFTGNDKKLRTKLRDLRKMKKAEIVENWYHTPIQQNEKEVTFLKWRPNAGSSYGIVKVKQ